MDTKQTRRVKLNGRKWVVGMEWSKSNDEKANRTGRPGELYTSWGTQYGFVCLGQKRAKELLHNPCVSAFMRIPLNSFLGCFTFVDEDTNEQFYWVFARNAGRNLGGLSDACYDSENSALDAVSTLKSLQTTNFDTVFVGESVEDSLEYIEGLLPYSFIDALRGIATLRPITRLGHENKSQATGFLKFGALTAFALWAAYTAYGAWQEHEAIQVAKAARERRMEYNRQFEAKPELLFNPKWNEAPLPETSILACFDAINDLPLSVSGWSFKSASCTTANDGKVVAEYDFMPGAEILGLPSNAVLNDKTGREMSFTLLVQLPSVRRQLKHYRELLKAADVSKLYFFLAQKLGAKISPFPPKLNPPETKQVQDVGQVTCPWTSSSWEISQMGPLSILTSAEILSKFPGLTVGAVKFDGNSWSVKGELYVQ